MLQYNIITLLNLHNINICESSLVRAQATKLGVAWLSINETDSDKHYDLRYTWLSGPGLSKWGEQVAREVPRLHFHNH